MDNNPIKWGEPFGSPDGDTLVFILHGMDSSIKKIMPLVKVVKDELAPARILVPEVLLQWNSHFDFKEISAQILKKIDDEIDLRKQTPYKRIYIIGHSAGGVLAQSAYLLSTLSGTDHGLAAIDIDKIQLVLLAPINRGWQISHYLPVTHKISWTIGIAVMTPRHYIASAAKRMDWDSWLMQLHRGSPFIAWLRLNWLKLGKRQPLVIQLLGSRDEIISWRDMVDEATAAHRVFFNVPYSNHAEIVNFEDKQYGENRAKIFRTALQADLKPADEKDLLADVTETDEIKPIIPWDEEPIAPDPNVKRVVFVIHGIRDEGHWTQKIANRARTIFIQEGLGTGKQIAVETSSYGYFSMLQFLLPWAREEKVLWLMDKYIEARRRYPSAKFSYIGHSHGTFLIARALSTYDDVIFERIAFAGSVVNHKYPWLQLLTQGRVSSVLNFTASSDWVVGIFPKLAQIKPLGFIMGHELGSAGSEPFDDATKSQQINNQQYIKGAHDAAIVEDNWNDLACFAVCNAIPSKKPDNYQAEPSFLFKGIMGWITCIGAWLLAVFLGTYWLPQAAWNSPGLFWGVGVGLSLAGSLLVAFIHPYTRSGNLQRRMALKKLSGVIFLIAFSAIFLFWLCWPYWPSAPIISCWSILEAVRTQTLSVVAYFLLLWIALTKV